MPSLTRCPHSINGWCLECVGVLSDHDALLANNIADAKERLWAANSDDTALGATSLAEWREVAREVVGMLNRE